MNWADLTLNIVRRWRAALALLVPLIISPIGVADEPYCGGEPYCPSYPPPMAISALDVPLNWYFMPRRPGCARHDYRYQVEMPEPCPVSLCGCGPHVDGPQFSDGSPVATELLDGFTPLGFERLGQIPNDSLLEAAAAGR